MEEKKNISKKIKIILVDDSEAFRTCMKRFLEAEFNAEIIGEAATGLEFLKLNNIAQADVVLMDLMMPEKGGYETAFEATSNYRNVKIIAVTNQYEIAYLNEILESGFKACVFKNNFFNEIIPTIEKVMKGEYYAPETIKM